MPGHYGHSVLNLEENLAVTENYFLEDSLEDWLHGVMLGETSLGAQDGREEELLWKLIYNKVADRYTGAKLR